MLRLETLVLTATILSQVATAQMSVETATPAITAFVNVTVVPMDRERILADQVVLVENGRITAVGPTNQMKVPPNALRIDGRGKFLIPGLADMHVHFGEKEIGSDSLSWPMLTLLANGITTVRNLNGKPWHVTLRERVAKGEVLGPRIYTAGPLVTQQSITKLTAKGLSIGEAAASIIAEHRQVGYDFLKLWGEAAAIDGPAFDTLTTLAAQANIRFVGHVPLRGVGIERMLQAHAASIEHLSAYFNRIVAFPDSFQERNIEKMLDRYPLDESKMATLVAATKAAGVWNCPTLQIYSTFLFPTYYGAEKAPTYLALRGRLVKALHTAGAGLLLGTDATPGGGYGMPFGASAHEELQRLVEAGLTPYQALEIGTRNAARFLKTLDSTGTVEVGKRADLVLLNGNPLQEIRNTMEPTGVMVAGRWLSRADLERQIAAGKGTTTPTPTP